MALFTPLIITVMTVPLDTRETKHPNLVFGQVVGKIVDYARQTNLNVTVKLGFVKLVQYKNQTGTLQHQNALRTVQ
jgi:hypothetical protein